MSLELKSKLRGLLRFITFASLRESRARVLVLERDVERVERERDKMGELAVDNERRFEAREKGMKSPESSPVADSVSHLQSGQILDAKLRGLLRFITFASLRESRARVLVLERDVERVERERDEKRELAVENERRWFEACERDAESPESSPVADSMSHLQSGQILMGPVTKINSHDVDVEIEGVTCPIYVPQSGWGTIDHPKELVRLGGRTYVKVLSTPSDALHPFMALISPRQARRELASVEAGERIGVFEMDIADVPPEVIEAIAGEGHEKSPPAKTTT